MKKLYARSFDYSAEMLMATGFDSEQAGLINIESLPNGDFRVWIWRTEEWVNDEKKASDMAKAMLTGDCQGGGEVNVDLLCKQVEKIDVASEEWEKLYLTVFEKHWNTEPEVKDDWFTSAKLLSMIANKDMPDLIIATAKIAEQVFEVTEKGIEVVTCELHVGDHKLFFRLATSKDAIDNLQKMLTNTVMVKAKEGTPPRTAKSE